MAKIKLLLVLILSSSVFSSCFDIVTEYTFDKDMSGTSKIYMDFSGLNDMDDKLDKMFNKDEDKDDKDDELNLLGDSSTLELLSKMNGIANLKEFSDTTNMFKGLSFDFNSLKSLNNIFNDTAISGMLNSTSKQEMTYKRRVFTVKSQGNMSKLFKELMSKKANGDSSEIAKSNAFVRMFFKNVNLVTRYKFSKKVKSTENKNSVILSDGKTVELKQNIIDLLDGKVDTNQKIKLKRR